MTRAEFPRVLAAEGVSNFGSMLSRLAIPWLATLGLQATPMQMGALLLADVAASAVGALLLGGWVDAHGKRAAMLSCDLLRSLMFAVLAWAAWQGMATLALLVLASAVNGLLTMGFELARSAWMAQRLAADELPARNAQLSAVGSLSETLAFAIGGWLYQGLGAAWALLVDGLSFLASAACLRGVRETTRPHGADRIRTGPAWRAAVAEAAAGVVTVAVHPALRTLAGLEALLAFGGALFGTSFMIFVTREAGYDPGPLGLVFAVGGLGAVAGAALAPRLGRRVGSGRAMALGLLVMTLGNALVPLAAAGGALGLCLLVLHQLVGDGGRVMFDVHDRTLRQTVVEPAMLARADAGIRACGQAATVAGALVGGAAGHSLGVREVLVLAVATYAAASLWAWRRRSVLQRP